ncbi:hypothetical protein EON62_04970, partial [archaeon]
MAGKKKAGDKEAAAKQRKEAKAAKQATKASKTAVKRAVKAGDEAEVEDSIEVIMASLACEDAKKTAVHVSTVERPSARANASVNVLPSGEMIVFGGEFWDGAVNVCYNELYRCNPAKGEWSLITSPNTPPRRCSHQAALVSMGANYQLYVNGGEFATNLQFYHYADTWRLDLATNKWTRVESKKAPSARSGHRMIAWRNYLVLFGGFYQAFTMDTWKRDLWIMDTRTGEWKEIVLPVTAQQPSARSGMQFHLVPGRDMAIMYGGYSEIKGGDAGASSSAAPAKGGKVTAAAAAAAMLGRKVKSVVHTDMWVLRLTPVLTGGLPTWERVRYVGTPPTPRLGFGMAMYKDRAILFGGVSDAEENERGENIVSQFHGDMFSYDVDRRRWFGLELKKAKAAGGRRADKKKGARAGGGKDASAD